MQEEPRRIIQGRKSETGEIRRQYTVRLFKYERAMIEEAAGDFHPSQWMRAIVLARAREVLEERARARGATD